MKRVLCGVLICLLLAGCAGERQIRKTVYAMDTVMDLQIWGGDASGAAEEIARMLEETERVWSATREDSFLSALNRGEAEADGERQAVLDEVTALSERTGGAFDPRLHAVISLWGFLTKEYRVPAREELTEALGEKQWNLGAAVKGYAGRKAAEILEARGVDRALLNLGGNVQTFGDKPDGSPWQIGIRNPDGDGYFGVVAVSGTAAVVTSGDYQRYFEQDGVRYHHILDPDTGYPAETGLTSVTVICRDGLTADALSTALYVMGVEKAVEFWRGSADFEAVFLLRDGTVLATEGAVLSGCEFEVIRREE